MVELPNLPNETCRVCGSPMQGDEPSGLCPRCLLLAGVTVDSEQQLRIRCPQCQVAIEIIDDPSVRDVTCPSCDSRFSLIGNNDATIAAEGAGTIGRFELVERVGIGAFGSVWKARDPELDRQVAVKLPRKEQLSAQESEQFLREARAAGQLKHPGIVSVHEVGRDGDRIYIVSDFIDGVTLADSIASRRPTIREAAELCGLIAEALDHAHRAGVIHRDLKPSNIMLDEDGRPHVMDFGLAKRESAEITMTVEGRILGTPAYMSPEQARGDAHQADARSDVYSLGVIFFEMLTGEKPFRGTSQMLLHQVLKEDAPSPRKLNGRIPRELETICLKCLEKESDRRYPTARDLAEDLQLYLSDQPIRSRPISSTERAWRWCRRNPVVAGLTTAVAVSLLVGLATTFWQWRIAQRNFLVATTARSAAEQSQQETEDALNESESRLARVYVERGLQRIDVDPHSGLKWLIQALETEPQDSFARRMHRLRVALMLRELPALKGFWPQAVDAQFSSDGGKVAIAIDNETLVFDLPTMTSIPVMRHEHPVVSIRFTPKGDRLATICWQQGGPPLCRIFNTTSGIPETASLDLSDQELGMRDMPTIHFTPDGDRFVAVYAGMYNRWHTKMATRVFDSRTMQQVGQTFAHHSDLDYTSGYHKLSPNAARVLVPRGAPRGDSRIPWDKDDFPDDTNRPQQYDLVTAQPVHPPLDHPLDFYGMPQYSMNGSLIATSDDGLVKVWNADNGQLRKEFPLSADIKHARVQFHSDGMSLFIIEPRKASWVDLASGDLKREWRHVDKFFVDPTGHTVIYRDPNGKDYVSEALPADVKSEVHSLPDLHRVTFSPDGSRFVLSPSGHNEAGIYVMPPEQVFRSADGKSLSPPWRFLPRNLPEPFSHNGRYYLCKLNEGIWLWDLEQQDPISADFPIDRTSPVVDATVGRDRKKIVVLTEDGTISCRATETSEIIGKSFTIGPPSASDQSSEWKYLSVDANCDLVAVTGEFREPMAENEYRDVHVVQLWNLETGQIQFDPLVFNEHVSSLVNPAQFIENGKTLVIPEWIHRWRERQKGNPDAYDLTRFHFINVATGAVVRNSLTMDHIVHLLDITSDGKHALVMRENDDWKAGAALPQFAPHVQMLSMESWQPTTPRMTPSGGFAWNAKLTADGTRLVMGNGEVWDTLTGKRIVPAVMSHHHVHEIIVSDDDQSYIIVADLRDSGDQTSEIRHFSIDGESLSPPMTNARTGQAHHAIHPTSGVLAAAGHHLRLWDSAQGLALTGAINLHAATRTGRNQNTHRSTFFTPSGNRLFLENERDLLVVNWSDVVSSVPPDDVLQAWSGILAGQRIDDAGGAIPLTPIDFQSAWNIIRGGDARED